jgi:hypothetical protein
MYTHTIKTLRRKKENFSVHIVHIIWRGGLLSVYGSVSLFDDCRPQANDSIHSVVSSTPHIGYVAVVSRGWKQDTPVGSTAVRHRRLSRESGGMDDDFGVPSLSLIISRLCLSFLATSSCFFFLYFQLKNPGQFCGKP